MTATSGVAGRVFVIGSVNEDVRVLVDRHARTGETVNGRDGGRELGGKGANQAIAAARAGAAVRFVGAVGDDAAGAELRESLAQEGVAVDALQLKAGEATGRAIVMVDGHGDNAIVVIAGANHRVTTSDVAAALSEVRPGDVVLTQLELEPAVVSGAARVRAERGALVVVNAAPFRADVIDALPSVDILIVNEHERDDLARMLELPSDTAVVGRALQDAYGTRLLCTLGATGSEFVEPDRTIRVPGQPARVVDTTGAGDTYIGYLVRSLTSRVPMEAAMRRASAAAALAVSRPGAARSIPLASELPPE